MSAVARKCSIARFYLVKPARPLRQPRKMSHLMRPIDA
ncbi:hypothetical protein BVG79_02377 [Ketogulonicigenium robustum]|uniref:Uncharacterized protein n=1 Tax=Ketogulonicigenium robustum TaxID=92947 RepID=A0A1W6P333_9RHOB|nr:hypothetical protein BVG79_02377 [Ketogulonicigenium robustum]